jgi:fused signal recognition particle receptor
MLGLFKKFKSGFAKTVSAIAGKTAALFGRNAIDASSLDTLEEALYTADFGVETTGEILAAIKDACKKDKNLRGQEAAAIGVAVLTRILAGSEGRLDIPAATGAGKKNATATEAGGEASTANATNAGANAATATTAGASASTANATTTADVTAATAAAGGAPAANPVVPATTAAATTPSAASTSSTSSGVAAAAVASSSASAATAAATTTANPVVIAMIGVNGSGQTTTAAKLAARLRDEGRSVILAACDTFRAAAIEQLKTWGERLDLEIIASHTGADAAAVAFDAWQAAKSRGRDCLIVDTAGRLHTKGNLMEELAKIRRVLQKNDPAAPRHRWLVVDGSLGSNSIEQARVFHKSFGLTGLVVTKLDGTSRGGALVGIWRELKIPIYFLGLGEQPEDLQPFSVENYARAVFGIET